MTPGAASYATEDPESGGSYVVTVPTAETMRDLGVLLAGQLRAGDVVLLSGPLGAGKTTLTQGIGRGLQVAGRVASPTFVLAREHPSLVGGPDLVHVDAYRLGGIGELDDLDLDSDLGRSVTVVEWGAGVAEALSADRLEIHIERAAGLVHGDVRRVRLSAVGRPFELATLVAEHPGPAPTQSS